MNGRRFFKSSAVELRSDTRGVTAIEFSLIMPVFLLLIYCFMELGRLLFLQNTLGHAVYEAERYAIVHGSTSSAPTDLSEIRELILDKSIMLESDNLTVSVTFSPDNAAGSLVEIDASYQFDFITGLIPMDPIDIEATTVATIAY